MTTHKQEKPFLQCHKKKKGNTFQAKLKQENLSEEEYSTRWCKGIDLTGKKKEWVDCVAVMLPITGLAFLHGSEDKRNEKRGEQRKGAREIKLPDV